MDVRLFTSTPGYASGAVLGALGLAGVIYALTEAGNKGWSAPVVVVTGLAGVIGLVSFVAVEARSPHPILPLDIFRSRQFTAANLVTFVVYGALGGALFLLPIVLQRASGFSPLKAGTAVVPLTIVMLLLSARAGRLAQRIGPRLPMTLGPIVAGLGLILLVRVGPPHQPPDVGAPPSGLGQRLADRPAVVDLLFGVTPPVGEPQPVAPPHPVDLAGQAAVNNEVARVAGLIAVAALPIAVGITASSYAHPSELTDGFQTAMVVCGLLCMAGGVLSWLTIRNPEPAVEQPEEVQCSYHCAVDATPLAG